MKINDQDLKGDDVAVDPSIPKVLLDTNVIFAYLNSKNPHHKIVYTAVEALRAHEFVFMFPWFIVGEVLCHRKLIDKRLSVIQAINKFSEFQGSLGRQLAGGGNTNIQNVVKSFQRHSRHRKFNVQHFSDYLILTSIEGVKNIRILTCDKEMYSAGRSIFGGKIYYLPSKTKGLKTQLHRLIKEIT